MVGKGGKEGKIRKGRGRTVTMVQMKNWDPLVSFPALAILEV